MSWYKDWFLDANYRVVYEHRDESEAERMIDLIERVTGHDTGRRVLDLACGPGRHAMSFARRGYTDVTGIDLSATLLDDARVMTRSLGLNVQFLERDMRELPDKHFDLIVNLFTSFGYFEEDTENARVIANVAAHIRPRGYFVIDFLNSHWVAEHIVAHDERILPGGARLEQTRWIEHGRIEKRLLIRKGAEAHEYIESVRLFDYSDFEAMFDACKLSLQAAFGNYAGDPFDAQTSPRLILFAMK